MLNKRIIHWLLLLLTSIFPARSQKMVFENLGVKQGLPAMEVYNLFQDPDGYVWVCTEYGIVKHNGSKFVPVCKNLPLKESAVYAVGKSRLGELYVVNSKARIYQIQNDRAILVRGLEKYRQQIRNRNLPVFDLFFDDEDKLYFSTFRKTYVIPKNGYWVKRPPRKKQRSFPVNGVQPLISIRTGVYKEGGMTVSVKDHSGTLRKVIHRDSIAMSKTFGYEYRGNSYFSLLGEIQLWLKDGTVKKHYFNKGIINFKIAPNGHAWVGISNGGLFELDAELNVLEHYLDHSTVSDILFDNQSGMWVSTIGEGVYHCRNTDNRSFQDVAELRRPITALKIISGNLFIGTAGGKLFVWDKESTREIDLKGNTTCINDFSRFNDRYYIGTKGNVYVLDHRFNIEEVYFQNGYGFWNRSDGSALMIVSGSSILKRKRKSKSFELVKQNSWNRALIERFPGEFFVSMPHGLARFTPAFSRPDYLKGLRENNISRIKLDLRKNVWICTKGDGLYRLTPTNKLIHYSNLPSKIINDVSFISNEIILLSTNKGAFVKRLDQLQKRSCWKQLLDEEVLRMIPFGEQIMIGTTSGLTSLNLKKLFRSARYRLQLSSVQIKDREIPLSKLKSLNYLQNDLYFNFDFLAFDEWSKPLVYTLKGPSGLSGEIEGTQIHLQNLSPGQYTLTVSPQMNLTHKNHLKTVTAFYIEPAFWQTSFFYVFMIVLGLVLTSLCSWLIMRSRRKKEVQRIRIEKLLAEYRLTALKAQVNPHFMSNSLVAIQELIIRKETSKANQYLAKFSALLRNLLNYSDQPAISLYNELKIIDLYIDLEQLRFSNRFVFLKEIDEEIQLDQLFIPALITQPLIENAIWHGLLPLSEERVPTLILSITLDKKDVCISIRDNGVGRIPKNSPVGKSGALKESKGMKLIENRIENLNKLYAPAVGSIEFIDLKDETGKPIGSTVRIFFSLDMINKLYHERNQERNH